MRLLSSAILTILFLVVIACQEGTYTQGERVYTMYCANCHMEKGEGLGKLIPSLNSDYYRLNRDKLPCIIKNGMTDSILVNGQWFNEEMLGFPQLNEIDIANLINYIDHKLLKEEKFTTLESVKNSLRNCD